MVVKNLPNILSIIRILLAPVFLILFLQETFLWAATSLFIFIFAALTDFFDGYFARRYKATSPFGTFLDPLADKILTFTGFFCLLFIDPVQFPFWMILIILFRDIFVTLLRMWASRKGHAMETRKSAKFKTFVQMFFLYLALTTGILLKAPGPASEMALFFMDTGIPGWLFIFVTAITVYTVFEYLYINRRLFFS